MHKLITAKKAKKKSAFKDLRSYVLDSTNFTNGCSLISIANPNYMAKHFLIMKVISYSKEACPLLLMYLIVTYEHENDVYVKITLFHMSERPCGSRESRHL